VKRLIIVFVGLVVLCGMPVGPVAQGFFATGTAATLGNIPLAYTGSTLCSDSPRSALMSMPSLYFGWLEYPTGSTWALQRRASTGTAQWPLKGWWFEATKEVALDQGFSLSSREVSFSPGVLQEPGSPPLLLGRLILKSRRTTGGLWMDL
jgi:hypothetical protein